MSDGNIVIVAPHPDDEIIGCFTRLPESPKSFTVIYDGDTLRDRREETKNIRKHFPLCRIMFQKSIPEPLTSKENTFYFPDPVYETHPLHRQWGMLGEIHARSGLDVVFYSTNMRAPYIFEVENPEKKREVLESIYPNQSDLWLYDHRYFLFEGFNKWIFSTS